MKQTKKLLSGVLAAMIIFSSIAMVFASENSSAKEEVIYIMAKADGSIKHVYVVNIFNGGEITDYGSYSDVKMLTTNDEIKVNGDNVTFSSLADKVYYQGTMSDNKIPWNISIRYYIDDKEYSHDEVAGKSGKLQIKLSISRNENYKGIFYDDFALQTTFLLDTEKASNIIADGSTQANIGKNKQLLYTVLPGKGLETEISADVVDFEMESVAINGIKLNLNIDVDTSDMTGEVNELQDGIVELDNGANELKDSTLKLKDGGSKLKDGASALNNGAVSLDDGLVKLKEGTEKIQDGINTLNEKSTNLTTGSAQVKAGLNEIQNALLQVSSTTADISRLTTASTQIKEGIDELYSSTVQLHQSIGYAQYKVVMSKNGLDIEALKANNTATIDSLNQQISDLHGKLKSIEGVQGQEANVAQLKEQIKQLKGIVQLLTANNGSISGTENYLNSLEIAIEQLSSGISELQTKYTEFDAGIQSLSASFSDMVYNMTNLAEGINKLVTQYSQLDSGIIEYTNGVKALVEGYTEVTQGILELSNGSKNLKASAGDVLNGVSEFADSMNELYEGTIELTDGTTELRSKTSDLDTQIEDKINEMISSVQGERTEIKSFTSEKNANIKSVQFVIKTDAIEKTEIISKPVTVEESLNFWQKLLRLFGLY